MGVCEEKLILNILEKNLAATAPDQNLKFTNYVDELQVPLPSLSVYRRNTLVYTSQIHLEEQAV